MLSLSTRITFCPRWAAVFDRVELGAVALNLADLVCATAFERSPRACHCYPKPTSMAGVLFMCVSPKSMHSAIFAPS